MTTTSFDRPDPLDDFERRDVALLNQNKLVFVAGKGPAVIVITEVPGITPQVARFARWVRDAGFTVWMPKIFGEPGQPFSIPAAASQVARACVSREFAAFAANRSSPITNWLRALAAHAHPLCGGRGVGAIGMCFTGNFALSMMIEPSMLAPVLCQPSLPLHVPSGLHISPDDLKKVKDRMDREDLTVLAYRFEGDLACRKERFDAYQRALGDRFVGKTLPRSSANPDAPLAHAPHSVVTNHLIDRAGEPTRQAVDEILAFFETRLLG